MKGSHVFNLHQSAIIKGIYCFDNVENPQLKQSSKIGKTPNK